MTKSMGVAVKIAGSKATSRVVVLAGTRLSPTVVDKFDLVSNHSRLPDRIFDTASHLKSRLAGLSVDTVVIRRADQSPIANKQEGRRTRFFVEGALTYVSQEAGLPTVLATGRDLAQSAGTTKEALDGLAAATGVGSDYVAACAAAMTALP